MPPKSEAQRRWAYANKDKKTKEGAAARKYVKTDSKRQPPERKQKGK